MHRLINRASSNRFVTEFYHAISLIFFYHSQWNKKDERSRNKAAVCQHLDYIDAILLRDPKKSASRVRRTLARRAVHGLRASLETLNLKIRARRRT
ncbi:FCD domain-containing protein [Rhizobium sp. No.120]